MKVIVCGGREFYNRACVFGILDMVHKSDGIECVVHGAQRGADMLADEWAKERGIQSIPCPADWEKHGPAAGPIRNAQMLATNPDFVIAFPGGKGTRDMVARAKRADVTVLEVTL